MKNLFWRPFYLIAYKFILFCLLTLNPPSVVGIAYYEYSNPRAVRVTAMINGLNARLTSTFLRSAIIGGLAATIRKVSDN